jgi:homotetrameric cytidine deaminase
VREPTAAELELYEQARAAAANAYVPYSRFAVGAALQTSEGPVVTGVNVENASFGVTNCAERTAVFAAIAGGHRRFDAIAVYADAASCPPCGVCRQVLAEFAPELPVVFRRDGEVVAAPLSELLPERFAL